MNIRAIFATDKNHGIGQGATMPWPKLSADLRHFSKLTRGHAVLMGSKTWHSDMPTPLPKRINIVMSNHIIKENEVLSFSGTVDKNLLEKLQTALPKDCDLWIIGGANILKQWIPYCSEVWHTLIDGVWECDTFFHAEEWQCDFVPQTDSVQKISENGTNFTITNWKKK